MTGLVIALAYFVLILIFGNTPVPGCFLKSSSFLYSWYWFWTIIQGIFLGLMMVFGTTLATAAGALAGSENNPRIGAKAGALAGFIIGGTVSFVSFIVFAIRRILLVGGAYFLSTSGKMGMSFSQFSAENLIIGCVSLFIGVILPWLMRKRIATEMTASLRKIK